jgi:hypothetical protein
LKDLYHPNVFCVCVALVSQFLILQLDDFFDAARKNGFSVERIAIVELDSDNKLELPKAKVQLLDKPHGQLPPVTQTRHRHGLIWIVRLRQMSYTFAI